MDKSKAESNGTERALMSSVSIPTPVLTGSGQRVSLSGFIKTSHPDKTDSTLKLPMLSVNLGGFKVRASRCSRTSEQWHEPKEFEHRFAMHDKKMAPNTNKKLTRSIISGSVSSSKKVSLLFIIFISFVTCCLVLYIVL